jgi:hypothetical protein
MAIKSKPVKKKGNRIEEQVEIFKRATKARHELAQEAFFAQDTETREVISRIQRMLCVNATGVIRVWKSGNKREQSTLVQVEMSYIEMNALYMAIEILKDLAMMDVRVANFKFPESFCAECGVKLNDRGKGKKRVKRKQRAWNG